MSEFDDLISKFGSGNNQKSNTDYSDLIKKFGSGETSVEPQQTSNVPRPFTADTKIEKGSVRRPGITEGIKALPGSYLSSLIEFGKEGVSTVGKGINQIATQQPASGVGNVGMGILQTVLSPYSAGAKEFINKPVTELTGNPELGERAEVGAALGFPLLTAAGKVLKLKPSNQAFDRLFDTIGDEKVLREGLERLKSNENLSVVDVFPSVKMQAQKLVTMEGKHQTPMIKKIEERAAGARGRVESLYDETMGAPIDVVQKIEQLKQRAKDTGTTFINPVVQKTGAVDVTEVVKAIDKAIGDGPVERQTLKRLKAGERPDLTASPAQQALWSEREKIRGIWKDQDQMFMDMKGEQGLHEVQKTLRRKAQGLLDSQNPADRELGNKLMNIRNSLVEAGGKEYKEVLGKYADDMSVQEAFQSGRNVLKNRPTHDEDRPEYLKKWLKDAKPDEIEAMREGARVAIDNKIRSMRFAAREGENIPQVEFTKEKLKLLFGKEEVEKLARKLADEKDIAQSTSDLIKGSQTAMRDKAGSVVALPERKGNPLSMMVAPVAEIAIGASTGVPGAGVAIGAGQLGSSLAFKGKTKLAQKANEEYAKLLFSEGEQRAELIKMLEQRLQSRPTMIQNLNRLGSVIAP